jgi:hypothetical protein
MRRRKAIAAVGLTGAALLGGLAMGTHPAGAVTTKQVTVVDGGWAYANSGKNVVKPGKNGTATVKTGRATAVGSFSITWIH